MALAVAAGLGACAPDAPDPSSLVGISPPPEAPGGLTVTPVSPTSIDITWAPPGGDERRVSGYTVYRDDAAVATVDEARHRDEGLEPFTEYDYTVAALNEFGLEGERSGSVPGRTLDGSPPLPPQNLSGQAVSSTQVNLSWSAASDPETGIEAYRIYRNGSLAGTTSGATSFSDTGLDPATEYSYEVAAVNGEQLEGERSSAIDVSTGTPDDGTPPTAPTGLSATAVSPSQVDLTWSAASDPESGVSGYRIYRDGARVGTTGDTDFTDSGLDPATEYTYEVAALNGDGVEGPTSDPATVTTGQADDMTPPTAPMGLSASAVSPSQVDLTWSAASDPESGVSGYRVYRDGAAVGTTSGNTRFSDTGLQASTTYVYQVSAINGDGLEGDLSAPAEATTPRSQDQSPPSTPGGLRATAVSGTQVNLTWSAASDPETGVASYRVYRDGAFHEALPAVASPSFSDVGLTRFTEYTYEVSAVNGDGLEGGRSAPAAVKTPDDSPPTAPSGLTATDVGGMSVDLTWSAASDPESGVSGYRIYRDGNVIDDVTGTSFTDSSLQPGTTYTYEVSAVNGDGLEGSRSASEQVTTTDGSPPTAPSGLTATDVSGTSVDLTWSAASDPESGVSGYRIYRDGVQIDETPGTTYSDTGLDPATEYRYEVSAVNGAGLEGPKSSAVTITTSDVTPPSAPQDLQADADGSTEVDLKWKRADDPESGISGYRIFRGGALVATTDGDDTNYTDTGLTPATTYTYEVSAVNGEGLEGPRSEAASATTVDDTPPGEPDDLTATPVSATQIDLSWSAASDPETGISAYRVYRDGAQVQETPAVPTRYSDTDLTPFTSYSYRVSAVNGHGQEGPMSPSVTVRTADGTPPTTPSNVSAGATGSSQVVVSWTASSDPETGVAGYRVFRDGTPVGAMTTNTFFTDTGLTPSTTYVYEVSAVNGEGLESARGSAPPVTTLPDTRFSTTGDVGAQALTPAEGSSP